MTEPFIDHFDSDVVFLSSHLGAQATYREEMGSTELGWNFACVLVCVCVCVQPRETSLIKWNMIQKTLWSLMTQNVPQERK